MGIYDELVELRNFSANDKEYNLWWAIQDHGSFEGPLMNWPSHIELWKKYIKDYGVCIQAGGNFGMYAKFLSEMFERVYTFEPTGLPYHCLVLNNQSENVWKCQAGLGEETGLCTVHTNSMENMGMNTVTLHDDSKVPMFTIDSLCLDQCSAIILDVEGFETSILLGALHTIDRYRPMISCENGNDVIKTLLEPFGYKEQGRSFADTCYSVD